MYIKAKIQLFLFPLANSACPKTHLHVQVPKYLSSFKQGAESRVRIPLHTNKSAACGEGGGLFSDGQIDCLRCSIPKDCSCPNIRRAHSRHIFIRPLYSIVPRDAELWHDLFPDLFLLRSRNLYSTYTPTCLTLHNRSSPDVVLSGFMHISSLITCGEP
jgi:hypothetical protein